MDNIELLENGVYLIQDCYGESYSVLYKNKVVTFLNDKHTKTLESIQNAWNEDYIISLDFVDYLHNF